nr:hypothetical protein BgiMline_002852 [Biomphalaria glabrata]
MIMLNKSVCVCVRWVLEEGQTKEFQWTDKLRNCVKQKTRSTTQNLETFVQLSLSSSRLTPRQKASCSSKVSESSSSCRPCWPDHFLLTWRKKSSS